MLTHVVWDGNMQWGANGGASWCDYLLSGSSLLANHPDDAQLVSFDEFTQQIQSGLDAADDHEQQQQQQKPHGGANGGRFTISIKPEVAGLQAAVQGVIGAPPIAKPITTAVGSMLVRELKVPYSCNSYGESLLQLQANTTRRAGNDPTDDRAARRHPAAVPTV